jgi:uncharacterized protein (TIGR02145 family)
MRTTRTPYIILLLLILTIPQFTCKKDLLKLVQITPGTFTDLRDGRIYKTTTIGSYTWLAENLDYRVDSSFYYNNDSLNFKDFGRLYTWNAAQAAIPAGWHLPTEEELNFLSENLGGEYANCQMREIGNAHWTFNNSCANNYSGLTVLPGGEYDGSSDQYKYSGTNARLWEAQQTSWNVDEVFFYFSNYNNGNCYYVYYYIIPAGYMLSIRCVKDY